MGVAEAGPSTTQPNKKPTDLIAFDGGAGEAGAPPTPPNLSPKRADFHSFGSPLTRITKDERTDFHNL